jgi:MFS family permease
MNLKDIFTSLHSRNYRLYFYGQGVSLIGTWMQNVALSWLVYRLTGSVFLLGLIGFTSQIPTFVLAPFLGVVTDRYNRLKLMTFAQVLFLLQALTMTLLVMFDVVQVWHIIVLSLIFGCITAIDAPTRQSLVIDLIDKPSDLSNAIALNSAIFNGARLIGPAVAGIIIAITGEGICFLINTISYAAVIYSLLVIKLPKKQPAPKTSNFKESLAEGFQYTFRFMPLRTLIIHLAVLSLMGLSFIVLLPAYAKEIIGGGADTLGFLMSALGAGALIGALYMAGRNSALGLSKIISGFSILMGCTILLAAFSGNLLVSMLLFFIGGLSMILSIASINILIQTVAEDNKRGRVMSFYSMALMGTSPIGNLIAGSIASKAGIPVTLILSGIVTILAGGWFLSRRDLLRHHVRPIYVQKGLVEE